VLAYLRHESVDVGRMLQAIASLGNVSAIVVCTDALATHEAQARSLSSGPGGARSHAAIHLHRAPLDLAPLLPQADVVISHGGGLLAEALVRGRPCVVLPSHYEQFLAARQAARHGLAVVVNPASDAGNWAAAVQHALRAPALLKACQTVERVHRAHVETPGAAFLARVLEGLGFPT
jgi:UDP:flavonoid glycosyltransferase YjiC (YdhE family)